MDNVVASETAALDRDAEARLSRQRVTEIPRHSVGYLILKRCFDFAASLCASALLPIPLIILALTVFLQDPGNPFYVQKRVGRNGKTFPMAKLRTMRIGETLTPEQYAQYKKEYKLADDPRLIGYRKPGDGRRCFGAFLRRTSLDELPQIIWNICIRGDMSIVGPRPIPQDELEENYSPLEQKLLLSMKPGLTGYWQAYARNNAGYADGKRQSMELYYVNNASLWLDIKIIWQTIFTVISQNGAK